VEEPPPQVKECVESEDSGSEFKSELFDSEVSSADFEVQSFDQEKDEKKETQLQELFENFNVEKSGRRHKEKI
jgi:hypothetical protein